MNQSVSLRFAIAIFCLAFSQLAPAAPNPATYFPGQLLVKFKAAPPGAAPAAAHLPGTRIKATMPRLGCQLVELPAGVEIPAALDYYRNLPNVLYAEPNYRIRLFKTPNDTRWSGQWGLLQINAP